MACINSQVLSLLVIKLVGLIKLYFVKTHSACFYDDVFFCKYRVQLRETMLPIQMLHVGKFGRSTTNWGGQESKRSLTIKHIQLVPS